MVVISLNRAVKDGIGRLIYQKSWSDNSFDKVTVTIDFTNIQFGRSPEKVYFKWM